MKHRLARFLSIFLSAFSDGAAGAANEADADFIRFDQDGNGKLDAWEITIGFEGYLGSKAKHDFFRDVDTNGDGLIDSVEYGKYVYGA